MSPRVNGTLERAGVSEVVRNSSFSPRGAQALVCTFLPGGGRNSGLIRPLAESGGQREEQGAWLEGAGPSPRLLCVVVGTGVGRLTNEKLPRAVGTIRKTWLPPNTAVCPSESRRMVLTT